MKLRKVKKQYYWRIYPYKDKYPVKTFKYKKDLCKYLIGMQDAGLNSQIRREINGINFSGTSYVQYVWYNRYNYFYKKEPFKLVIKKELFRGNKYICSRRDIDKSTVRYFTKSEQIINLMLYIGNILEKDNKIYNSNLKNLINLFKYRFGELPDNPNGYGETIVKLEDCEWWYWSDRCNYNRASVIIKCIRNEKPYLLKEE